MKKILIVLIVIAAVFAIYKAVSKDEEKSGINLITATMAKPSDEVDPQKPDKISIYIESSGSMKPYFATHDDNIINTVSRLNKLDIRNTNIYFVGDERPRSGYIMQILGNIESQPYNATTTFHDYFGKQVAVVDTSSSISFLVTDGLMSVGKRVGDTKLALEQLEGKITSSLKQSNVDELAAAIFRYTGKYKGTYWHQNDSTSLYDGMRPYYVIALGQKPYIKWLASLNKEKLNNPEGSLFIGIHSPKGHTHITQSIKSASDSIINPLKDVTLSVDLPDCIEDLPSQPYVKNNGTLLSSSVERTPSGLKTVIPMNEMGFSSNSAGVYETEIVVENRIPDKWNDWSTDNDLAGVNPQTTFGLKNLIGGIFKALEPNENFLVAKFRYTQQK